MFKRALDHVRAVVEGRSPKWFALARLIKKEHPFCAACGGKKKLQVHHKKPYHKFPELELDRKNTIVLCQQSPYFCHIGLGHLFNWKSWNENVEADAADRLDQINHRPS